MNPIHLIVYRGFNATACWDDDQERFYGQIKDTVEPITFFADDVLQLQIEFEDAVDEYLDMCEELGRPPHY